MHPNHQTEEIQGRIIRPLGTIEIKTNVRFGTVIITNPKSSLSADEPKYINVMFKKWAGLKPLLQRNRYVFFTGYYSYWESKEIGKVFVCESVREIKMSDARLQSENYGKTLL